MVWSKNAQVNLPGDSLLMQISEAQTTKSQKTGLQKRL